MEDKLINAQEVAYQVKVSIQTLGMWYKFKKENPYDEYSLMLPDFTRIGASQTRYWKQSDVAAIKEFKDSIPKGRNGVLGSVSQRYVKAYGYYGSGAAKRGKSSGKADGGYIDRVKDLLVRSKVEPETIDQVISLLSNERNGNVAS